MPLSQLLLAGLSIGIQLSKRLAVAPITWLVPRDPRLVLIVGRNFGTFADNTKYLFCWLCENPPAGRRIVFIARDMALVQQLASQGAAARSCRSLRTRFEYLRAGMVIFDSSDAIQRYHFDWFRGAKLVQLWHGAGLKTTQREMHNRRTRRLAGLKRVLANIQAFASNKYPLYDVFVSTSEFYTQKVFSRAFRARLYVELGYPRNDCLNGVLKTFSPLHSINVDSAARSRIAKHRQRGGKVVLYAPTFRDDRSSPFCAGGVNIDQWSAAAAKHNTLIVLKLHPLMEGKAPTQTNDTVIEVEPASDIYPLLSGIDLLVTDYSSICTDFLLLDRPIVFFPYDFDNYAAESCAPMFDYDTMTPGPKAANFSALLEQIEAMLYSDADHRWVDTRANVRKLAFVQTTGCASERVWNQLDRSCPLVHA